MTAADLIHLPDDGQRSELISGRLVSEPPAGGEHGWIGVTLAALLRDFVRPHHLGFVLGADTGFILSRDPDTVRAPDAAYVACARMPDGPTRGFIPFAPDLAAEIVSPSDRASDVTRKVLDYLRAGTRIVWVIDPATRTVLAHNGRSDCRLLGERDTLDGLDVLPGFRLVVKALLDG